MACDHRVFAETSTLIATGEDEELAHGILREWFTCTGCGQRVTVDHVPKKAWAQSQDDKP